VGHAGFEPATSPPPSPLDASPPVNMFGAILDLLAVVLKATLNDLKSTRCLFVALLSLPVLEALKAILTRVGRGVTIGLHLMKRWDEMEGRMSSEKRYCLSMRSSASPFAVVESGTGRPTPDGNSSCRSASRSMRSSP
jgi:hypothetical protein